MIEPKFIELMNVEWDGLLAEKERAELQAYLSSHPEAMKYFEGLRTVLSAVDSVGPGEPPSGLHEKIMDAVPFSRASAEVPRGHFSSWWGNWFGLPRMRYAAVFIVGVVFGVLVYTAMNYGSNRSGGGLDSSEFMGTIGKIEATHGFRQIRAFDVDLGVVQGTLSLHEAQSALVADVALDAGEEIEWIVDYNAKDVTLDGYRRSKGSEGDVLASTGEMRVQQSGDARYLLLFTKKNPLVTPFVVKIFSADRLLLEQSLSPAAKSTE
jgi:hypothetical protein